MSKYPEVIKGRHNFIATDFLDPEKASGDGVINDDGYSLDE